MKPEAQMLPAEYQPRDREEERAVARRPSFGGLAIAGLQDLMTFADLAAKSGFAPKGMAPPAIAIAVQFGAEIGLSPMQSLQSIGVINGKPALYGDAPLALCKNHPDWEGMREWIDGDGDRRTAHCEVKRRNEDPVVSTFSVGDAKRAGLWGKAGPWQSYPDRMQQFRARGFALRDAFPDALKGLISEAEARDYPERPSEPRRLATPGEIMARIEPPREAEVVEAPPAAQATNGAAKKERIDLLKRYSAAHEALYGPVQNREEVLKLSNAELATHVDDLEQQVAALRAKEQMQAAGVKDEEIPF